MTWQSFYESIELTPEEEQEAIREAKRAKYFREKHAQYWQELETKKAKDDKKQLSKG